MDILKIPAEKLKPSKYNPRKDLKPGDPEYEKLRRSIEEFGYVEPVIWNKRTGNIVGGHQRYKVLTALGYKEIDCVVVDLDEQREKALNVALNKISGEFDIPLLTDLLMDLNEDGFDVSLTGFLPGLMLRKLMSCSVINQPLMSKRIISIQKRQLQRLKFRLPKRATYGYLAATV